MRDLTPHRTGEVATAPANILVLVGTVSNWDSTVPFFSSRDAGKVTQHQSLFGMRFRRQRVRDHDIMVLREIEKRWNLRRRAKGLAATGRYRGWRDVEDALALERGSAVSDVFASPLLRLSLNLRCLNAGFRPRVALAKLGVDS